MRLGQSAVAWARAHVGQGGWGGRCEQFVRSCFGLGPMYPSAKAAWNGAGGKHHGDFSPPPGVPVFWNLTGRNAPYGHIALSIGGGYAISSSNSAGRPIVSVISIYGFTDRSAPYLGWAEVYHGVRVMVPTAGQNHVAPQVDKGLNKSADPQGKHALNIPQGHAPNLGGILNGIDVHARWQSGYYPGKIPGVSFTISKCTGGNSNVVPGWDRMIQGARLRGLYHYARDKGYTDNNPVHEADLFVDQASKAPEDTLLFLDWEEPYPGVHADWILTWMGRVEERMGRKPMFYTYKSVIDENPSLERVAKAGHMLWLARYLYNQPVGWQNWGAQGVQYWGTPKIWQYSSAGNVPGWGGALDLNIFYGDASEWLKLAAPIQREEERNDKMYLAWAVEDNTCWLIGELSVRHISWGEYIAYKNLGLPEKRMNFGHIEALAKCTHWNVDDFYKTMKAYEWKHQVQGDDQASA